MKSRNSWMLQYKITHINPSKHVSSFLGPETYMERQLFTNPSFEISTANTILDHILSSSVNMSQPAMSRAVDQNIKVRKRSSSTQIILNEDRNRENQQKLHRSIT